MSQSPRTDESEEKVILAALAAKYSGRSGSANGSSPLCSGPVRVLSVSNPTTLNPRAAMAASELIARCVIPTKPTVRSGMAPLPMSRRIRGEYRLTDRADTDRALHATGRRAPCSARYLFESCFLRIRTDV